MKEIKCKVRDMESVGTTRVKQPDHIWDYS